MHRYISERLMTVEEAERLSGLGEESDQRTRRQNRRPSLWAWQTVSGALEQTVTDEQIDRIAREFQE